MVKINTPPAAVMGALSRAVAYAREIPVARLVCAEFVLICLAIILMSSDTILNLLMFAMAGLGLLGFAAPIHDEVGKTVEDVECHRD